MYYSIRRCLRFEIRESFEFFFCFRKGEEEGVGEKVQSRIAIMGGFFLLVNWFVDLGLRFFAALPLGGFNGSNGSTGQ